MDINTQELLHPLLFADHLEKFTETAMWFYIWAIIKPSYNTSLSALLKLRS